MMISDIYCGQPTNLGLLGSLSVILRGSTVRHPVITKSSLMSEFGRVTVTTKLGQLSQIMTDFQLEQLDKVRSGERTRDLKHRSTLTIPLRHHLVSNQQKFFCCLRFIFACRLVLYLYTCAVGNPEISGFCVSKCRGWRTDHKRVKNIETQCCFVMQTRYHSII